MQTKIAYYSQKLLKYMTDMKCLDLVTTGIYLYSVPRTKLANIINKVVNSSLKGEDEEYISYVALHNSNNNGVGNHTEHFSRFFVMVLGLV